jgi:hypothetical protein
MADPMGPHASYAGRMEALWESDFRLTPAAALLTAGVVLAVRGVWMEVLGLRTPLARPGKNLATMRGMRLMLFGSSVAVAAAGWLWQVPALVAAGLVIGFEETVETSIVVYALRKEFEAETGGGNGT